MTDRLKQLLHRYGRIALVVYLALFAVVYLGFLVSISAGVSPSDTTSTVGVAGAAWLATKVTQPVRIGATLLLTPLVGRLFGRTPLVDSPPDDPTAKS